MPLAPLVSYAPVKVAVPEQVMLIELAVTAAVLIAVALLMTRGPNLLLAPAADMKVTLPVPAVNVSAAGPFNELTKMISPTPAPVLYALAPVMETAPLNVIVSFVVVIVPAD